MVKLAQFTIRNIIQFNIGMYRYELLEHFPKLYPFLVRRHIREQIAMRLIFTRPACYEKGACIECGCMVPALQFANKNCDGNYYPPMMPKRKWKLFKAGRIHYESKGLGWSWNRDFNKMYVYGRTGIEKEVQAIPAQKYWYTQTGAEA